MVRKEGQESGIGVWEVDGHEELYDRLDSILAGFIDEQDFVNPADVSFEDAYVVGSYGNGDGVPGKSDLDLNLSFTYSGDYRENDLSRFLCHAVGAVVSSEDDVLRGFGEFAEVDVIAFPMLEVRKEIRKMAQHEPVDTFYSLKEGTKQDIW